MPPSNDPKPSQPDSPETAEAWLAWARGHHHTEGCQCHGCIRARALLAEREFGEPS
jgi:hypothetical protein